MTTKTDEQEREAFKRYYHTLFDLSETTDTWGNPRFVHESVESIWYGWKDRAALQSQDREDAKFLQDEDQHDLHRFIETTEDGQGYDIGKERIKRLTELGVVSNQGFGRYSVTMFGYWCHEKYWHQNPSLPLKTVDEYNAEQAIDHARRIEGES